MTPKKSKKYYTIQGLSGMKSSIQIHALLPHPLFVPIGQVDPPHDIPANMELVLDHFERRRPLTWDALLPTSDLRKTFRYDLCDLHGFFPILCETFIISKGDKIACSIPIRLIEYFGDGASMVRVLDYGVLFRKAWKRVPWLESLGFEYIEDPGHMEENVEQKTPSRVLRIT